MISEAKNKVIDSESQDEPITLRAVSQIKNEYHFSGSGKYKPMNIVASNIAEATETWKSRRQLASEEEKREDEKTNNE